MRRSMVVVACVAVGLLAIGCGRSKPRGDVGEGPASGRNVPIFATDNRFSPKRISARAGEEFVFEVHNNGRAHHDFTIDAIGVSTGDLGPRDVAHGRFRVPKGEIEFHCRYHSGMKGTIVSR